LLPQITVSSPATERRESSPQTKQVNVLFLAVGKMFPEAPLGFSSRLAGERERWGRSHNTRDLLIETDKAAAFLSGLANSVNQP